MSTLTTQTVDPTLLATMNPTSTTKSTAQAAQDRFMTLLVTQMKNQDPFKSFDNAPSDQSTGAAFHGHGN